MEILTIKGFSQDFWLNLSVFVKSLRYRRTTGIRNIPCRNSLRMQHTPDGYTKRFTTERSSTIWKPQKIGLLGVLEKSNILLSGPGMDPAPSGSRLQCGMRTLSGEMPEGMACSVVEPVATPRRCFDSMSRGQFFIYRP